MEVDISYADSNPDIVILSLHGDLDGSTYQDVIDKAHSEKDAGATYMIIDMTEVPFMGSAGLVALHSIALLMQGEELPDPEDGWGALHNISSNVSDGPQKFVKIVNPQPSVDRSLDKTGMKEFFEVHADVDTAVASF